FSQDPREKAHPMLRSNQGALSQDPREKAHPMLRSNKGALSQDPREKAHPMLRSDEGALSTAECDKHSPERTRELRVRSANSLRATREAGKASLQARNRQRRRACDLSQHEARMHAADTFKLRQTT